MRTPAGVPTEQLRANAYELPRRRSSVTPGLSACHANPSAEAAAPGIASFAGAKLALAAATTPKP